MGLHDKPLWIYLDQNKWIDLARAYYHQPRGERFAATLERAWNAVKQDVVRFPISAEHINETMKTKDEQRRRKLSQVMVELSLGRTIAPYRKVISFELDTALAEILDQTIVATPPPVFGRGVDFACGQDEAWPATYFEATEGLVLALNSPIESVRQWHTKRFEKQLEYITQEAENLRGGERKLTWEVRRQAHIATLSAGPRRDLLQASLSRIGRSLEDFLALSPEQRAELYQRVPTLDLEMELNMGKDELRNRRINAHDWNDMSFLCVAIPYCDIVITEKMWVDIAKRRKLDQKYNTILLTDVAELEAHLPDYVKKSLPS